MSPSRAKAAESLGEAGGSRGPVAWSVLTHEVWAAWRAGGQGLLVWRRLCPSRPSLPKSVFSQVLDSEGGGCILCKAPSSYVRWFFSTQFVRALREITVSVAAFVLAERPRPFQWLAVTGRRFFSADKRL